MKTTWIALAGALALAACSPSDPSAPGDGGTDTGTDAGDVPGPDGGCSTTAPYCSTDHTAVVQCDPASGDETVVETCDPGEACVDAACVPVNCPPNATECIDDYTMRICRPSGADWDVYPCPATERCDDESGRCEPPCDLRIFILLDQSGSMGGEVSPTKWEQAQTALATLMTSDAAEDVEFGLGAFPMGGDSCAADGVVIHPIPTATADLVDDYFGAHPPSGATPLVEALQYFIADTSANLNDPAYHNALLLVSDGSDTCYIDCMEYCPNPFDFACITNCENNEEEWTADALREATVLLRDNLEIRTYVIGFGSGVSDEELTAIAENGGTEVGHWISASDIGELEAAFQAILDEMLECNPIMI